MLHQKLPPSAAVMRTPSTLPRPAQTGQLECPSRITQCLATLVQTTGTSVLWAPLDRCVLFEGTLFGSQKENRGSSSVCFQIVRFQTTRKGRGSRLFPTNQPHGAKHKEAGTPEQGPSILFRVPPCPRKLLHALPQSLGFEMRPKQLHVASVPLEVEVGVAAPRQICPDVRRAAKEGKAELNVAFCQAENRQKATELQWVFLPKRRPRTPAASPKNCFLPCKT